MKEMNNKKELLMTEKNKMLSQSAPQNEVSDSLDEYMSGLSSQLGEGSFNIIYQVYGILVYFEVYCLLVGLVLQCAYVCMQSFCNGIVYYFDV